MKVALLTVSDSAVNGTREDKSGPTLRSLIDSSKTIDAETVECCLVEDDRDKIAQILIDLCTRSDVIITTGGTGFAPRDVTPEATLSVIDKRCGGLETALHMRSLQSTPLAALSRLCVGIRGHTLIVNLPGSTNAVKECFDVLDGVLSHAVSLIKNEKTAVEQTHCSLQKSTTAQHAHQ